MPRQVWLTGTLVTPDDSDTSVYGDPTEPGHGEVMVTGWVDPDWSLWQVEDDRDNVRPDVMDADEERSPAQWLADTITSRCGSAEPDSMPGVPHWFSGVDAVDNYGTGQRITVDAHPEGFTEKEMVEAAKLMGVKCR